MWSSFWKEVTAPLPSQHRFAGDDKSDNRRVRGRQKDEVAAADGGGHVEAIRSEPAADYTTILRGVIVGEEQSGKTSLIRRLRGEDPFQKVTLDSEPATKNTNRRSHRNLMALIPWKIPQSASFRQKNSQVGSENLVQLYVSEGTGFCYSKKDVSFRKQWISVLQSQQGKEFDFVVWMIDPRRDNVLDFLREGLSVVVPSRARESDGHGDKESAEIIKRPLVKNMCILLNFKDSTKQNSGDQASLVGQMEIVIEDVLSSHIKVFEKHRQSSAADTSTPTILIYETSMKDGYGLSNLLSFIYLPYLSLKEREFQRLAEHAQRQHSQWKQRMMTNKGIEYDEFIEQRLGQQKPTQIMPMERQRLEEEKEQLRHLRQQSRLLQSEKEIQGEACVSVKYYHRDEDGAAPALDTSQSGRFGTKGEQNVAQATMNDAEERTIFGKSLPFYAKRTSLKKSGVLEDINYDSFFSDDEEVGESGANDSSDESKEDDSDDGDFYIDVSGVRCAHVNGAARVHTKKSSLNRIQIDKKNEGVTTEVRSKHLNEKNETMDNSSEEDSVDAVPSAEQVVKVTDEKSVLSNHPVPSAKNAEEEEAGEMIDDASESHRWPRIVDKVITSDGIPEDDKEATTELAAISERFTSSPSFDDHNNDNNHDGISIDETTSTNSQRANDNIQNMSGQIASESFDKPMETVPKVISANDGEHSGENDSDDDSSFQIAESQSKVDYLEQCSDKANRKDKDDRGAIETRISNVQIDDSEHQKVHTTEKSHLVLDSDEEDSMGGTDACDGTRNRKTELAGRDAEFTNDATHLPRQSHLAMATLPNQLNEPPKSVTVSSAARAAIEAARIEAEKMIAQSQHNDVLTEKRDKKKNKDGKKKKKKEKKEKRHDS
jgi:GTPase SAR1 family protein